MSNGKMMSDLLKENQLISVTVYIHEKKGRWILQFYSCNKVFTLESDHVGSSLAEELNKLKQKEITIKHAKAIWKHLIKNGFNTRSL